MTFMPKMSVCKLLKGFLKVFESVQADLFFIWFFSPSDTEVWFFFYVLPFQAYTIQGQYAIPHPDVSS